VLGLTACAFVAGCDFGPHPESLLHDAYDKSTRYDWAGITQTAKRYLLEQPRDDAGHFMLGQAYLHRGSPYFTLAEGELQTALAIALADKEKAGASLRSYLTASEFLGAVHRELALVHLRWVRDAAELGVPQSLIEPRLEKVRDHVERGLGYDPESNFLRELESTLNDLSHPAPSPVKPEKTERKGPFTAKRNMPTAGELPRS